MISDFLTLEDGTVIEFFASDYQTFNEAFKDMFSLKTISQELKRAKQRKKKIKSQTKARRIARGR